MEVNRILADTSAYSAFMSGHGGAVAAIQEAEQIYVNPVIIGELLTGFLRGSRTKKNEQELQEFLASPRVRELDVDRGTARRYAIILNALWKAGTPIPTNDIWIAATAMQHGLELLTLDAHYLKVSQIVVRHMGEDDAK